MSNVVKLKLGNTPDATDWLGGRGVLGRISGLNEDWIIDIETFDTDQFLECEFVYVIPIKRTPESSRIFGKVFAQAKRSAKEKYARVNALLKEYL